MVHVDGTARIQTVDPDQEPLVAGLLDAFERRTGLPVVVNTCLNTAGRPMVDDPRDALECFGSAPVDVLALGPFLVRRPRVVTAPAYSVVSRPSAGRRCRRCSRRWRGHRPRRRSWSSWSTTAALRTAPLDLPVWDLLQVLPGPAPRAGRGPQRRLARDRDTDGWPSSTTTCVPGPDWAAGLVADLAGLPPSVAGSQGRLRVPLPAGRRPTDWERGTAGLADGALDHRRHGATGASALVLVGGFDERFRRAYREDADLALRLQASGWSLVRGARAHHHPVRPAARWVSPCEPRPATPTTR